MATDPIEPPMQTVTLISVARGYKPTNVSCDPRNCGPALVERLLAKKDKATGARLFFTEAEFAAMQTVPVDAPVVDPAVVPAAPAVPVDP